MLETPAILGTPGVGVMSRQIKTDQHEEQCSEQA